MWQRRGSGGPSGEWSLRSQAWCNNYMIHCNLSFELIPGGYM